MKLGRSVSRPHAKAGEGVPARARWDRITEILSTAWDLPPESRDSYISECCGTDDSMRSEVERLLQELNTMSGILQQPAASPTDRGKLPDSGSKLGPYLLGEQIGEGGMGVVFRAVDTRLGRRVALKLLRGNALGGKTGRQRFFQEARMMAALNHPAIVTIYDIGTSGDLDFIAMEYVDGKPLDRVLEESRLPLRTALSYARQIGGALSLAHSVGIVHRDLKPGNILIGENGAVKVLDFGLAKWTRALAASGGMTVSLEASAAPASNLTMEGDVLGTIAYMSPEQATGKAVDERSDVFSFGAVLYEMLSGKKAFGRATQGEVVKAITGERPAGLRQLAPQITPQIAETVQACLKRDPAARPDIDEVVAALDEELDSGAGWTKGRVAAAVVTLVAALGAGVWWLAKPAAQPEIPLLISRPITAYAGHEVGSSFSPDGTKIAFAWQTAPSGPFHIYTRGLRSAEPHKLTTDNAGEHHPSWSPDGKWIAYLKDSGQSSRLMVVSAVGGTGRELADPGLNTYTFSLDLSWSPDSQWIAFAGAEQSTQLRSIFAVSMKDRTVHKLTQPKPGEVHVHPAISKDGKLLAFTVDRDGVSNIATVQLTSGMMPAGDKVQLEFPGFEKAICHSPMWRANGELMFAVIRGITAHLWSVALDERGRATAPARPLGSLGEGAVVPTLSHSAKGLIFSKHSSNENIHIIDFEKPEQGETERLLASAYRETWPRLSADGKRITFESDRGGMYEVWVANRDGSDAYAVTHFQGPVTGSPTWSPDGGQLAFDSRASGTPQVWVIAAEKGAKPRQVTTESSNYLPAWSADGRDLFFVSNRSGEPRIWRMRVQGGPAEQISQGFGFAPHTSPDGTWLYYMAARSQHSPVRALNLKTGQDEVVTNDAMDRGFSATARGLYYLRRAAEGNYVEIRFWDPARKRDTVIRKLPHSLSGGFEVFPDDRSALITQNEFMATDLMMVEEFQ